ncbi:MAG: NmrA family NAD(P)-binding protein [Verrucomicrobiota bacterium]
MKTQTIHNHPESKPQTTLVLGGTGKTGRRIVQRLQAKGVPVRVASRSGETPFEWNDPTTWAPAIQGVHSIYIAFHPDLAVPGAKEAIQQLVDLAKEADVKKLVLLSGRGEEEAQRCEKIVQESGLDWTVVRCGWFNQNFSENFMLDMVLDGVIALPFSGHAEPFVDVDDIADVATAALTETGHSGQVYELTGPELLTFPEIAEKISKASGKEVRFQPISREEFVQGLLDQQVPKEFVDLLDYLFTFVLDGRNSYLADGVQRALGRAPRDFDSYARDVAATGCWNPEEEPMKHAA